MTTWKAHLFGFSHRFAYATLFSAMIWIGAFLPLPEGTYPPTKVGIRNTVLIWFDLPIAVTTQILPCDEFAIDLWFTVKGGELCPGNGGTRTEFFVNHMRVGISTYMLIFYLPSIFRAGRGWWLRRRGKRNHRADEKL